ncbi:hypothetical protein F2Q68_00028600 [Brassica cretica]|uniref:Uncharacterized protein n=1 Tax=Brassica cretica TaxID=69181 RepID=A0A8S9G1T9_BRACR|nr:hypothetical protein F2Q68_00028600 [Brassica cretica]
MNFAFVNDTDQAELQHVLVFAGTSCPGPGMTIFLPANEPGLFDSPTDERLFLLTVLKISVIRVLKEFSTLV